MLHPLNHNNTVVDVRNHPKFHIYILTYMLHVFEPIFGPLVVKRSTGKRKNVAKKRVPL